MQYILDIQKSKYDYNKKKSVPFFF